MDKKELRRMVLSKRSSLTEEMHQIKSRSIVERIIGLPEFSRARTVMTYLDFKGEVETKGLVWEILNTGKRAVVPLCHQNNLIPCLIDDPDQDIHPGTWGVPEPREDRIHPLPPGEIDLIIVPGVAFDTQGNRLGYGKGYYDRFLPHLRDEILKAGICFDCQIVDSIQADEYDYKMSMVITESGVIYPAKRLD